MVILVDRLHKLYHKLENHHHHHHHNNNNQHEALSASLHTFQSDVSNYINQFASNSKPGSKILSLSWIHQFFQQIPMINRAFAKLVVDIDYPMSKWKAKLIEEYLKYSLDVLDILNCISSSLSHLAQARILMSHALSLMESSPSIAMEKLKAIEFKISCKDLKKDENFEDGKELACSDEEWIVHQAFLELKSVGLWTGFLVSAGLSGDDKPYLQVRKSSGILSNSSLINLGSIIHGAVMEKGVELEDIKELKDAINCLEAAVAAGEIRGPAEEMQRRLEVFEKQLDGLGQEVEKIFSEVMAGRNELLDGIRCPKK